LSIPREYLYVESSRSWGGQEYRTCLEINWLNGHGHKAWLVCNPGSQVQLKATELGTRPLPRCRSGVVSIRCVHGASGDFAGEIKSIC